MHSRCEAFLDFACPVDGPRLHQGLEFLAEVHSMDRYRPTTRFTGEFIKWVVQDVLKEEAWRLDEFGAKEKDMKNLLQRRASLWYASMCAKC